MLLINEDAVSFSNSVFLVSRSDSRICQSPAGTVTLQPRLKSKRMPRGPNGAVEQVAAPNELEAFWDSEYQRHLVSRALAVMRAVRKAIRGAVRRRCTGE